MPTLQAILEDSPKILAECAIAERLRRLPKIELHPTLFNTPLIYGPEQAKRQMSALYEEYLNAAKLAGLPLLLTAPTWRLDSDRVAEAGFPAAINQDAVNYLLQVSKRQPTTSPILVGALTGPKNDCYRPDLAPDRRTAENFHSSQIDLLASTQADFLLAQTLPSVEEALGISRAMARTGKPYIISFCTGTDGHVLDGTPLDHAMDRLDQETSNRPTGYFVNCTHPRFLIETYEPGRLERLIGIQANASSKDVTTLDSSSATEADTIDDWANSMHELQRIHDLPVLGGCCGTTLSHMEHLISPSLPPHWPPHSGERG